MTVTNFAEVLLAVVLGTKWVTISPTAFQDNERVDDAWSALPLTATPETVVDARTSTRRHVYRAPVPRRNIQIL